jgi:hypothetical protein
MTIYRVVTGTKVDFYGYNTHEEIAQYFFNKEDAEALYNEGKFTVKATQITTIFADGTTSKSTTGAQYYERNKANAKPNEKVELIEEEYNHYRMEEVEVR